MYLYQLHDFSIPNGLLWKLPLFILFNFMSLYLVSLQSFNLGSHINHQNEKKIADFAVSSFNVWLLQTLNL